MHRIRATAVALVLATIASAQPTVAIAAQNPQDVRYEQRWDRHDDKQERKRAKQREKQIRRDARAAARQDAREDRWDAARYYRHDDRRYGPRRMTRNDRIYRGSDNRYYCRRDDGTSGLIIGGLSGGILGNIIAPGGSKTLGTILGAGAGAVIGRALDRGDLVCR